ncbi:hypothetical protein BHAOGJBA_4172 [Methylobacterium hispanicum]|uniref:Uncharacterized protein n=1 Tax=Methylobacterium hispanicum TaxID=270350 RepID=A0AAV4ZSR7_9HYPH|nr:hypothetical protein [Methylobacterium hispanicum]GJD90630.1 hypothetical protein BHAOGJBA_4172 [Methylobacterium hispanicum]
MKDAAVARRYAATAISTYVPEGTRPEQSRIMRATAMLALAAGIGVTLLAGKGPDLSEAFGRRHSIHMDGQQALEVMRIQAYAAQPSSSPYFR